MNYKSYHFQLGRVFFGVKSPIYDKGFERTGCMFCMYGCHNKGDKRFELMKQNYPKIYDYCMNKLKMKEVLDVVINKGEKH